MESEKLRKHIADMGYPEALFFDGPGFDRSIVCVSVNGSIVYDYDLMVDELATEYYNDNQTDPISIDVLKDMEDDEKWDVAVTDAIEWIDYNTIRTIPYIHGCRPIIIYKSPEDEKYYNIMDNEEFEFTEDYEKIDASSIIGDGEESECENENDK